VDVRSAAAHEVVRKEQPRVICHHAAQIDVRRSMADPRHDADVNVGGLLNLMQAAVEARSVEHVLFASSGGATYGDTDVVPTPESHPQRPVSHYGAAKAASELYLGVYRASHGIPFAALRYSNVYGPRQDPHGEAGVVAIFFNALRAGHTPKVFGDGRQTRDYVFVGDVARATVAAAERDGGVYNVGTGRETSVVELLELCQRIAGTSMETEFAPARPGELQRAVVDPSRAVDELGWRPEHSLEDGLGETWEFFRG
jgi:UDP-glucose 4-epimerase